MPPKHAPATRRAMPALALHCARCGAALQPAFRGRLRCPLFSACGSVSPYEVRRRREWRGMVTALLH